MNIRVNQETHEFPPRTSISQVIEAMGLNPKYVAVEVNLELIPRSSHAEHLLQEGDELEVVTLVGGG